MGNKLKNKRSTARRAAGFLATLGLLAMSSGIALMVSATPANAAPDPEKKVVVCKYVSTPGGELQGGNNPIEPSLNSLKNAVDDEWLENPTFPKAWGDAQGQDGGSIAIGFAGEGLGIEDCPGFQEPPVATASATPVQPTCADLDGSYTTAASNAEFAALPAAVPGSTIHLTANATGGAQFAGGATTLDVPVTLDAAPTNCGSTVVSPPLVNTPKTPKAPKSTVTPTVVHAGLTGTTVQDVRGEQGLALMVGGMLMLAGAGGLRLRSGRASRI